MAGFIKEELESSKYGELVKLAKEHGVYRRYATKAELVEKLLTQNEPVDELLDDVSMPHLPDVELDENGQDANNSVPSTKPFALGNATSSGTFIQKCSDSRTESPSGIKNRSATPRALRRSLAGPAKGTACNRQTRQGITFKSGCSPQTFQAVSGRVTRKKTVEVGSRDSGVMELSNVGNDKSNICLKREGTFDVVSDADSGLRSQELRREGTFEVKKSAISSDVTLSKSAVTFIEANSLSHGKEPSRVSQRTSHRSPIFLSASPVPLKLEKISVKEPLKPSRLILSERKTINTVPFKKTTSASKSKIPSLINEIKKKKSEVSEKTTEDEIGRGHLQAKKIPDFSAIHKRLFRKMESLVDSRQKVIDKVNSIQKIRMEGGKRSSTKPKVVRKLMSPKAGKSKLVSPKPVFRDAATAFTSNVVAIQKRPSSAFTTTGVSHILPVAGTDSKGKHNFNLKKMGPSRRDIMKDEVLHRKPVRRISPMSKAKQTLQTVRLNKRFELQMKHRLAQQLAQ